jgi:hypothetical protein
VNANPTFATSGFPHRTRFVLVNDRVPRTLRTMRPDYRYCSRNHRHAFVADLPKRLHQERSASTYFEWLFLQSIGNPQLKLTPAVIRIKAR